MVRKIKVIYAAGKKSVVTVEIKQKILVKIWFQMEENNKDIYSLKIDCYLVLPPFNKIEIPTLIGQSWFLLQKSLNIVASKVQKILHVNYEKRLGQRL